MTTAKTTVRAVVIYPDCVEVREIFNDSLGFRVSLGDYRTGIRWVPLTSNGDLLVINEDAVNLLLPYNTLATMVMERFHPGWGASGRLAGPALILTYRDGSVGDVNVQLAELIVNAARDLGLRVSEGPQPSQSHRSGPMPPPGGAAAPRFAKFTTYG